MTTMMQNAVAIAARTLIGVRFRPQGRDPAYGLDCVGVVLLALAKAGKRVRADDDYPKRGGDLDRLEGALDAADMQRVAGIRPSAGDVVVMRTGAAQYHLGIATTDGMVHADAGLRRVVETPGPPRWPVLSMWRAREAG